MKKEIITGMQIFMLTLVSICGFVITMLSYEHFSGNNYPFVLLLAFTIAIVFVLLLSSLYFKGGLIKEENSAGDRLVLGVVALFLIAVIAVNFYSSLDFWNIYDYRKEISAVFVIMTAFVIYFCSCFGIEVIARLALWVFVAITAVFITNTVLLRSKIEFSRLLPFEFQVDMENIEQILFFAALCLPAIIITLIYSDSINNKLKRINIFLPIILGMLLLLIVIFRTVLVLGSTNELYAYALIQSLKLIQFPGGLAGVELFGILIIMSTSLFYLILLNCATARLLRQIIPGLKNIISCIIPIGIAVIVYLSVFKLSTEKLQPYFSLGIIISAALAALILFLKNIFTPKQENALKR